MSEEKKCECNTGHEECCDTEFSTEDLAESNNVVLNSLIELLINKKVITEEELEESLAEFDDPADDEEDDKEE